MIGVPEATRGGRELQGERAVRREIEPIDDHRGHPHIEPLHRSIEPTAPRTPFTVSRIEISPLRIPRSALFLVLGTILVPLGFPAPSLDAQDAEVRTEENVRAAPNGTVLGQLREGAPMHVFQEQGDWLRAGVEGWIWMRSLQVHGEGDFDLIVSAQDGENLRLEPQGRIIGRFEQGSLLEELERIPGWVRVRREIWIWQPSVEMGVAEAAEAESELADGGAEAEALDASADTPLSEDDGEIPILSSPAGDSIGLARSGADLQILSREGTWGRVRLEGWVQLPEFQEEGVAAEADVQRVSPEAISEDPDRYRAQLVDLPLQYISVEQAERARSDDFYEGEPFLLMRAVEGARIFVYVAIPPERLAEVDGLLPLEEVRIIGRIRTPAASLTGSPVLDLLELRRSPR